MSDYLAPTEDLGRRWCPTCEPDADPTREILDTLYCEAHRPAAKGSADDETQTSGQWLSGSGEAEAAGCRAVQAIIRALVLVLLLGAAGCAKAPVYLCVPVQLADGTQAIGCAPQERR